MPTVSAFCGQFFRPRPLLPSPVEYYLHEHGHREQIKAAGMYPFLSINWYAQCEAYDFILAQLPCMLFQCLDYKRGRAFGNLCSPLCDRGEVAVLSCQSMHKGKSSVFTARWNDTVVVIKSHRIKSEYIPLVANASESFPDHHELTEMVLQSLRVNFGVQPTGNLTSLYPFLGSKSITNKELMNNLWQLSQDNEYVTLMINEHSRLFPRILASCGTFYAMEYAQPISQLDMFSDRLEDFIQRIRQAEMILKLLKGLETSFEQPLHMCDVKLEHFGQLDGNRLVLLDSDTVFPKPVVDRSVADGRRCVEHHDCDLFDCRSLCNTVIGLCDSPVVNNNLQLVCQKIFIEAGLLTSQHLPKDQHRLLEECARPYSSLRQAASLHLQLELEGFFKDFLHMAAAVS